MQERQNSRSKKKQTSHVEQHRILADYEAIHIDDSVNLLMDILLKKLKPFKRKYKYKLSDNDRELIRQLPNNWEENCLRLAREAGATRAHICYYVLGITYPQFRHIEKTSKYFRDFIEEYESQLDMFYDEMMKKSAMDKSLNPFPMFKTAATRLMTWRESYQTASAVKQVNENAGGHDLSHSELIKIIQIEKKRVEAGKYGGKLTLN